MDTDKFPVLVIAAEDVAAGVVAALPASRWTVTVAAEPNALAAWQNAQEYAAVLAAAALWSPEVTAWPVPAEQPRKPLILLGVPQAEPPPIERYVLTAQTPLIASLPPDSGGLYRAALPPLLTHLVACWHLLTRQETLTHALRQAQTQIESLLEITRQRQSEELTVLHTIATVCAQANDENVLIEQVTQIIGDNFYPDNFGFMLLDENASLLRTHSSYRLSEEYELKTVAIGQGVTGTVALTGESLRLDDVAQFPSYLCGDRRTRSEVCVPLKIGQRVLGVINAESAALGAFTAADERLLATLASQFAIAIERLRRESSERYQTQQLAIIYEVGKQVSAILDQGELMNEVARLLAERMNYYNAAIALVEGDTLCFRAGYGGYTDDGGFISDNNPLIAQSIYNEALQEGKTLLIQDVDTLPDFEPYYRLPHIRAVLGVPLRVQGQSIGLLTVSSNQAYGLTPGDASLLEILADQVGAAMRNARLYGETQRQMRELTGLYETALATGGVLSQEALFLRLYEQARDLLSPDIFLAVVYLENSEELEIIVAVEEGTPIDEWQGWRLPLAAGGLTGWMMQQKRPLLVADMETALLPREPRRIRRPVRSWLGVPLVVRDWVIGAFSLQSFRPNAFTLADQRFVESMANQVSMALQNARLFEETNHRARQLAILNGLAHETSSLMGVDEIATLVTGRLVYAFGYLMAAVYLVDEERGDLCLRGIAGIHAPHLQPLSLHYPIAPLDDLSDNLSRVFHSGNPVRINQPAPTPDGGGAQIILPLKSGDQVIGVLQIDDLQSNSFDESDLALLTAVADQLAVVIEKARLLRETQRRANELEALTQISTALRAARTVDEILPVIVSRSISLINGSQSSIYLIEPETHQLVLRARHPQTLPPMALRQSINQGITGYVARTGKVHITQDLHRDPLLRVSAGEVQALSSLVTMISLPLRAEAEIIGVMHLGLEMEHTFTKEELRILTAIAEIAGSAIYRAVVMETLEYYVALRTQELAQANERLQEMDRLKSKFVADVSHELRTPIANLLLYLDLLERGAVEKRDRYLSVLQEEARRLTKIIDPILNFSQLNLDGDSLDLAPLDLNPIVWQVVDRYLPASRNKGLTLRFEADDNLPRVNGNVERLVSVVTNLVANAVNYSSRGQIQVKTFCMGESHVCLQVQDEGVGISPHDRPHLFEGFYRGEQASQSNTPGSGLGLTIVREVVQQHGGYVEVQSEPGRGALFQVVLPAFQQTRKMPA
ncbi:MAG: GAF domain-containing protein [Anaerolineales bacterium]|nr:GAF domain-containing protein [Anaerolineales bacterium]MCB8951000.1 GAF domain-containing protein [Ardenticatenales bacterium]